MFVIIDFFVLSFNDPSDPRLKDPSYSEPDEKLVKCYRCDVKVSRDSHHCNTCNRCVDHFDHHCVFLNNCIGGQNYSIFFRLLLSLILHMTMSISIGIIMFIELSDGFRWVGLTYTILSAVVFIEVLVLAVFHCYIGFCLYKTTLQVLRGDTGQKIENENKNHNVAEIHP